ncbi:hypothetical protein [Pseudorhodoferax sp.]|uniref:hypothetical protein n=1 Tax=Pseudorhodoferax sp. TaxID=1993553 RepID=UPI0039E4E9F6
MSSGSRTLVLERRAPRADWRAAGRLAGAAAAVAVVLAGVVAASTWWTASAPAPRVVLAAGALQSQPAPVEAEPPDVPPPQAPQPDAAAADHGGPAFDNRNLYSLFQLALASTDPAVVAEGIAAWRACASYVGDGTEGLQSWLDMVLPEDLAPDERERRARHARAAAARCAGFIGQPQAAQQAEALMQRAREAGSALERLRDALASNTAPDDALGTRMLADLACDVVRRQGEEPRAVRWIGLALRGAADRPTHPLHAGAAPERNLAMHLAYCDLDPQGCDAHSSYVGSACVLQGRCDYAREEDYWREQVDGETYAAAQPLREALVQKVQQGDCTALFD